MKRSVDTALFAALLPLVALLPLAGCQQGTKAAEERAPTPVHAVPVRLLTPESGERYSASLTPERELTLSFRVPGFVESIFGDSRGHRLEAGDAVPAGATLATLRPADYDIPVQLAIGQLESARRNSEAARSALAEA